MQYRRLGNAGVKLSVVGLGTNRFGSNRVSADEVRNILDAALDLGINHIDTANTYQHGASEETLGRALAGRWDRFFVATKCFFPTGEGPNDRGGSRYHVMNAIDASLTRLRSDHVDMYYIHRWDPDTPLDETLRAFDDMVHAGKVRYVGVSDFAAWQLAQAGRWVEFYRLAPVVALQSHFHLLQRDVEHEILPYCAEEGIGFIPYFPLAGGFLTGKYRADRPAPAGSRGETSTYVQGYMTPENYRRVEALERWCFDQGRTLNTLAIAWLLAQPAVCSVVSGATSLAHVEKNAAAGDWTLSSEDLEEVAQILAGDAL